MKPAYLVIATIAAACGWFGATLLRHPAHVPATHEGGEGRRILLYQSPMHPWVKSDKPGQCTVCGMDLVPIYEGGRNFDHAAGDIVMLPRGKSECHRRADRGGEEAAAGAHVARGGNDRRR